MKWDVSEEKENVRENEARELIEEDRDVGM